MADDAGGDPDASPEDDRADQNTEHAVADHSSDHDYADPAHAGALHHVELCASDLDSTLLYEDRHLYAGGYYALYCEDSEGITVEVVAPAEKRD